MKRENQHKGPLKRVKTLIVNAFHKLLELRYVP